MNESIITITLRVPRKMHKEFKLLCVKAGKTLQDTILEYIQEVNSGKIILKEVE